MGRRQLLSMPHERTDILRKVLSQSDTPSKVRPISAWQPRNQSSAAIARKRRSQVCSFVARPWLQASQLIYEFFLCWVFGCFREWRAPGTPVVWGLYGVGIPSCGGDFIVRVPTRRSTLQPLQDLRCFQFGGSTCSSGVDRS